MSKKICCDVCGTLVCELTKGKWKNNSIAICSECNKPPIIDNNDNLDFLKSMMGMMGMK